MGLGTHEPWTIFGYRKEKSAYASAAIPFLLLILLEIGLGIVFLFHSLPPGWTRNSILVVLLAVVAFPLTALTTPLFTAHRLNRENLELRYGLTRIRVPFRWIDSVQPQEEKLDILQPLRVRHQTDTNRLVATFSGSGLVCVSLSEPRDFAVWPGRRCRAIRQILFNVDQRADFLAALTNLARPDPGAAAVATDRVERRRIQAARPSSHLGTPTLEARGLWLRYGESWAVQDLTLRVGRGEIYGFVGSNGAGKTTTLKMLSGILQPDRGKVRIAGHDLVEDGLEARAHLGFSSDTPSLYERLTGLEYLQFLCQVRGFSKAETDVRTASAIEALELKEVRDELCGTYSLGFRKRLALAAALLGDPDILLLDEPLTGLDPLSASRLKSFLNDLACARGVSVFFSSHDLAAVESMCHRIGVLHRGSLVAEGSPMELRHSLQAPDLEAVFLRLVQGHAQET